MKWLEILFISVALDVTIGITTIHHDKPKNINIKLINNSKIRKIPLSITIPNSERQKRLHPYINYYYKTQQNPLNYANKNYHLISVQELNLNEPHQIAKNKFTPFLESNALPGKFTPIKNQESQTIHREYYDVREKNPNYSNVYDKLSQINFYTKIQPQPYNLPYHPSSIPQHFNILQPESKTIIESYTPKNIDLTTTYNQNPTRTNYPSISQYIIADKSQSNTGNSVNGHNQYLKENVLIKEPIIILQQRNQPQTTPKIYQNYQKPIYYLINPQQKTQNNEQITTETPPLPSNNVNKLANLLKQLQHLHTLPQTLTSENIDNSIKTLIKILNDYKQQKTTKPIIEKENITEDVQKGEILGVQIFPADTEEGGTPGKPGVDYPAFSTIPQTDFNCKTQRYKGFFGDPNTNCQVWHYCDLNGGQASFLCPNGTIFSQVALTCDWWYNVKCATTTQLYVLNERLYKYILPLSPKFPEDYSGPLVDKYIAMKFKEMEEKMAKERKGKGKEDEKENEDNDNQQEEKVDIKETQEK